HDAVLIGPAPRGVVLDHERFDIGDGLECGSGRHDGLARSVWFAAAAQYAANQQVRHLLSGSAPGLEAGFAGWNLADQARELRRTEKPAKIVTRRAGNSPRLLCCLINTSGLIPRLIGSCRADGSKLWLRSLGASRNCSRDPSLQITPYERSP